MTTHIALLRAWRTCASCSPISAFETRNRFLQSGTGRNWNTVLKLGDLAGAE